VKIDIMTDVAGEMATITQELPRGCKECHKACTAAVEMLAVSPYPETLSFIFIDANLYKYKCRKAPRRIDQLPVEN